MIKNRTEATYVWGKIIERDRGKKRRGGDQRRRKKLICREEEIRGAIGNFLIFSSFFLLYLFLFFLIWLSLSSFLPPPSLSFIHSLFLSLSSPSLFVFSVFSLFFSLPFLISFLCLFAFFPWLVKKGWKIKIINPFLSLLFFISKYKI